LREEFFSLNKINYYDGFKPPLGGLGVKNMEDYAPCGRVILLGNSPTKKPCHAKRGYGLYYFHPFEKQAFHGLKTIKPCCFRNKAFSL
jgi:hypothetical protein